jgi:hypothetical protein
MTWREYGNAFEEAKVFRSRMKRSMSEVCRFSLKLSVFYDRYFAGEDGANKNDARTAWLLMER